MQRERQTPMHNNTLTVISHFKIGGFERLFRRVASIKPSVYFTVIEFLNSTEIAQLEETVESETIAAKDLKPGDVIWYDRGDEWARVISNYLHPRSPYAKLSIIPESCEDKYRIMSISGLHLKVDLNELFNYKRKESMEPLNLQNAIQQLNELREALAQYYNVITMPCAPNGDINLNGIYLSSEILKDSAKQVVNKKFNLLSETIKKRI